VKLVALRWADPPSKESYRLCKKIKKLKKQPRSNKDCRAVEREIEFLKMLFEKMLDVGTWDAKLFEI
jgi:hypothetical protein